MSTSIDLYWSFRSPYSYLALKRINEIQAARDVVFNPKIVLPLAIRAPAFFDTRSNLWLTYVLRDVVRIAQMTGQTIAPPIPDPVVQNLMTREISPEQPHIWHLSRLGIAAVEAGEGLAFITEISTLIWSGQDWTADGAMAAASARAGLDFSKLDFNATGLAPKFDKKLADNARDLRGDGHWGVPTCVIDGEPFFGMDRLDVLEWRLDQMGIA